MSKIKQNSAISISAFDVHPVLKNIYSGNKVRAKRRKRFSDIAKLLDLDKGEHDAPLSAK